MKLRALSCALVVLCTSAPSLAQQTPASWPAPDCVREGEQTACGYHCVSDFGQVRCAHTPYGACTSGFGQLYCWDPPPVVPQVYGEGEPPQCVAQYGQLACGYHCVADSGQVRCAYTPVGACLAQSGEVQCWDPPEAVVRTYGSAAQATCMAQGPRIVCGYNCGYERGRLQCSSLPDGR